MTKKQLPESKLSRRGLTDEFKQEAVQMGITRRFGYFSFIATAISFSCHGPTPLLLTKTTHAAEFIRAFLSVVGFSPPQDGSLSAIEATMLSSG